MREADERSDDIRGTLELISDLAGYHGVENVGPENTPRGLMYVNTGETYDATVGYDEERNEFVLTSWGDWIEAVEAELAEEEEEEEREPATLWSPHKKEPLIAVLRSVEGPPIAVHLMDKDDMSLAFSVPADDTMFYAQHDDSPYRRTWASLIDAFKRGQDDVYVTSIRHPPQNFGIERSQFERLSVAMDAFMEAGLERQPVKYLLEAPPVLWTCGQVSHVVWYEERGVATVEAHVGDPARINSLSIWSARSPELEALIEDGFLKWKRDDTVREYLKEIGVCR